MYQKSRFSRIFFAFLVKFDHIISNNIQNELFMTELKFEVFYDGDCPLCLREINLLKWMDRKSRILFTDIAAESFDPTPIGKSMDELMARIHGRLPDGSLVEGVEVFRRLYGAVGLNPIVALTRLPGIKHTLDIGYVWFAKNRLRLTGRCNGDQCKTDTRSQSV